MPINTLLQADITDKIIGAFFAVYRELGFGFLETVYGNALSMELARRDLRVKREVPVEVFYKGASVGAYRFDVLVEGVVLVELKSAEYLEYYRKNYGHRVNA